MRRRSPRPAAGRIAARVAAEVAAAAAVLGLITGCTVGPSNRAPLATYGQPPATGTQSSAPQRPVGPGGPGQQAEPLDWGRCYADVPAQAPDGTPFTVQCAAINVPQDYSEPAGSTLQLEVARAIGAHTSRDAPALVVVLDGPGDHGRDSVAEVAGDLPDAVVDSHVIVTIDLRGAGSAGASQMRCLRPDTVAYLMSPPMDPTNPDDAEALQDLSREAAFNCTDEIGPIISEFGSIAAADDLDSLRSALGTERLRFFGRGFGGTLGAVYAHRHPGRVQRMVLDGPTDPHASLSDAATARAVALEAALDDFAARCTAAGDCPLGPQPRVAITDLIAELGDTGRPAGSWLVTGGSVLLLLSELLGDPAGRADLTAALGAAHTDPDDLDPLAELLVHTLGVDTDRHLLGPRLAYTCNDAAQRLTSRALSDAATKAAEKAPTFGAFMVGQAALCSDWPTATEPLGRLSGAGAPPILVIGSVDDPRSPYGSVKAVVSQLASAVLISWQSGTHGAVPGSSCVTAAVRAYLIKGTVPAAGELCPP